jgi:hypothetical protein
VPVKSLKCLGGWEFCGVLMSLESGEIDRLVLNSLEVRDSRELERAIVDAANQGLAKVRELQEAWPFSELGRL